MLSFVIGLSVIILVILFIYGFVNYNLKTVVDRYINSGEKEDFSNRMEESVRPIDECVKYDMKGNNKLYTNCSGGIPDAPYKYDFYVGDVYRNIKNESLGKENGPYCVKKPKLLFDGIWSPYIFAKDGYEKTEWSLTNGNLFEGEICMKSLFNTLKPMPKWSPPDCQVKCLNDCQIGTYCNGPVDNDRQDITDPKDSQVICFPSIFSPDGNKDPLTRIGF